MASKANHNILQAFSGRKRSFRPTDYFSGRRTVSFFPGDLSDAVTSNVALHYPRRLRGRHDGSWVSG
jgi:hypothetical protein